MHLMARIIETTAEKAATSSFTEEPNTPLAVQVERVSNDKIEQESVDIIDDEFCFNGIYIRRKPSYTPSSRASGAATSTSRLPGSTIGHYLRMIQIE
jgi:hypothetical protein